MGSGRNSDLAYGTSGSPQLFLDNSMLREYTQEKEKELAKEFRDGRTYKEYVDLARDPSHGNKVFPQGRKEREIGLDLEKHGILHKIIRDPDKNKGAEFIDTVTKKKWDIKSFVSYPNGHRAVRKGAFDVEKALNKIKKEINNGHYVIIDTRRLIKKHKEELIKKINEENLSDKIIWYHKKLDQMHK